MQPKIIFQVFHFLEISEIPAKFEKLSDAEPNPVKLDPPTKALKSAEPSFYSDLLQYKSGGNSKAKFICDTLAEKGKVLDKVRIYK